MADLNYNVPDEIAAAFREFCDDEGLTQLKAVQWACFQLMNTSLADRRKLIDSYKTWLKRDNGQIRNVHSGQRASVRADQPVASGDERTVSQ